MKKQIIITTRVGKYVWEPILEVIDFIPKGDRRAMYTLHVKNNTELNAMIVATTDMLKKLKETKADRKANETTQTV